MVLRKTLSIITNLTDMELTENKVSVLKYGLKYGLLTRPKKSEMIEIVGDIWKQILRNLLLKEDHILKHRLQNVLKSFTYKYLDLLTKIVVLTKKESILSVIYKIST